RAHCGASRSAIACALPRPEATFTSRQTPPQARLAPGARGSPAGWSPARSPPIAAGAGLERDGDGLLFAIADEPHLHLVAGLVIGEHAHPGHDRLDLVAVPGHQPIARLDARDLGRAAFGDAGDFNPRLVIVIVAGADA